MKDMGISAEGYADLLALPERLPGFFILGGPKCGTTSLFAWLGEHPDTYLPAKEPNFLSRDIYDARDVPGAATSWEAYLGRLMPETAAGKLTGESTPRYLYSDLALDILTRHPAQPRLIAILRNPIDLIYSLHGQMLRQGVEREADFAAAWARALARHGDPEAWRGAGGGMDRRLDYPMFGLLGARIEALLARAAPGQAKILILEEGLKRAPEETFAEVLGFVGLPPAQIDLTQQNTRSELRSAGLNRLAIQGRAALTRISAALGRDVTPSRRKGKGTGLLKLARRLNTRSGAPAPRLDPGLRAEMAAYFAKDVARLTAALGRSTPPWADWQSPREPAP